MAKNLAPRARYGEITKRLEHGVFLWPSNIESGRPLALTSTQLSALLEVSTGVRPSVSGGPDLSYEGIILVASAIEEAGPAEGYQCHQRGAIALKGRTSRRSSLRIILHRSASMLGIWLTDEAGQAPRGIRQSRE